MNATIQQWKPDQPAHFHFGIHEIPLVQQVVMKKTGTRKKLFMLLLVASLVLSVAALVMAFLTEYYYVQGDAWVITEMVLLGLAPLFWIPTLYLRQSAYRLQQLEIILQSLEELRLSGAKNIRLGFNAKTILSPDHIEYGKKERDCFAFISIAHPDRQEIITLSVLLWSRTVEKTIRPNTPQQTTRRVSRNLYQLCFHCFRTNAGEQGPVFLQENKDTIVITSEWTPYCTDQQEMETSTKSRPGFSVMELSAFLKRNLGR